MATKKKKITKKRKSTKKRASPKKKATKKRKSTKKRASPKKKATKKRKSPKRKATKKKSSPRRKANSTPKIALTLEDMGTVLGGNGKLYHAYIKTGRDKSYVGHVVANSKALARRKARSYLGKKLK